MRSRFLKAISKFSHTVIIASILMVCYPVAHADQKAEIIKQIPSGMQLVDFSFYLDEGCKIQKGSCLTFKMTLKNTSNKAQRYITRITLPDEGKSVGGFVPRKGKKDKATGKKSPPVVEQGKEVTVSYPMFYNKMPNKVELEISLYE